jgi:hypothetical protein
MTESKKAWVEPELIVLVRSKPEEAVLSACKSILSGVNPGSDDNRCVKMDCELCVAVAAS